MTTKHRRIHIWFYEDCKLCQEALKEIGGADKIFNNWQPVIPKGYVLVLSPDYNAPSPSYPDGLLTHFHLEMLKKKDVMRR